MIPTIPDDNLMDISLFNPHLRLYLDQDRKEYVEQQLGDIRIMLYEWESNMMTHRVIDIIELALLECKDNIVYRIISRLDYNNNELNYYLCFKAARYGRLEVIYHMIDNGYNDWNKIAYCAAFIGDKELLDVVIKTKKYNGSTIGGANNWKFIAAYAALGGHSKIVKRMFREYNVGLTVVAGYAAKGGHTKLLSNIVRLIVDVKALNYIAKLAATNGHSTIIDEMIMRGANNFNEIATYAAKGGYREIVTEMTEVREDPIGNRNVDDYSWIAKYAASGGHREIVNDMIRRGADKWLIIAEGAAYSGSRVLMMDMLDRYQGDISMDDWTSLANNAASGGCKEIVKEILERGVDVRQLDFAKHEDARIYFS